MLIFYFEVSISIAFIGLDLVFWMSLPRLGFEAWDAEAKPHHVADLLPGRGQGEAAPFPLEAKQNPHRFQHDLAQIGFKSMFLFHLFHLI